MMISGLDVIGIVDPVDQLPDFFQGINHIQDDVFVVDRYDPNEVSLVNGVGLIPGGPRYLRKQLFTFYKKAHFSFSTLIHPNTTISPSVKIGEGSQVMAGTVIKCDTNIGMNTIINTNASIDHDCNIGDHVHVAPSVVLCGGVELSDDVFIGTSATILPNLKLAQGQLLPAASVLKEK